MPRPTLFLLPILALAACEGLAATQEPSEMRIAPADEPRVLDGEVYAGFERFAFNICRTDEESGDDCPLQRGKGGDRGECWLQLDETARDDLIALTGSDYVEDGSYRLQGTGTVRTGPGRFGHLGGYPCEVRLESIRSMAPTQQPEPREYYPPPASR
ncbi:hypothetical protein [Aurantiacibacter gangjinensis]|nr:hypothetical protein [Aurantiacibacter gangjinensis]